MRDFCKYEKYKYDLFLVCTSSLKKRYFVGMKKHLKKKQQQPSFELMNSNEGCSQRFTSLFAFTTRNSQAHYLWFITKRNILSLVKATITWYKRFRQPYPTFLGSHDNLYFVFECDLSLSYLCSLANSQHWNTVDVQHHV